MGKIFPIDNTIIEKLSPDVLHSGDCSGYLLVPGVL